jgi:ABC-type transport system involved in multi-copper enzyme maturation permease subunit
MITVIKRELLDHLQSVQFIALLCICIVLFLANGMISVKRYNQQASVYNEQVASVRQNPSTNWTMLYRQSNQLSFVVEGGDKYRPYGYTLRQKGILDAMPSGPRNFKLPEMPELDWSFIIKIIFSLYVILLGFNAISGEKEQGTLRLTLSNSIGRVKVLVAKYIAILLIALVPLLTGVIISLIIVGIFVPQVLTLANVSRILLMFLLTLIYLSLFAFLSLLFSSLIHRSSLVLLILLAIWVVFAVIIPNASGILSQSFSRVPSEYQTAKMIGPMIQQQVWARIRKISERVDKGELKTEEEVKKEADGAFNEGQEELIKHYKSYEDAMKQRAMTAESLSRISPTALFQYASENIAQTGTKREEQFLKDARSYSNIFDSYVLKKVGKLVGTSMWSFVTNMTIGGKSVYIHSPYPEEYKGDKSDFPQFVESQPSLARSLRDALFDIAGLIVWNLILATLAFSAFLRADVR